MSFVLETARIGDGEKLRRNSDSALFFRLKEETPALKILNERIAVLERKLEQFPPDLLDDCSPEEPATEFSRQQESWKGNNLYFTEQGGKRCCQPRRSISLRYKKERTTKNKIKSTRRNLYFCDIQKASEAQTPSISHTLKTKQRPWK